MSNISALFESNFASEQSVNIPMLGVSAVDASGKNVPFENLVIESIEEGSWGDDPNNKTLDVTFVKYEELDGVSTAVGKNTIRIFNPFNSEYYGGEPKTASDLINDFVSFRTDIQHLFSPYFTSEELNFNVWEKTKITSGDILQKIVDKNDVNTLISMFSIIFANCTDFAIEKFKLADKSIKLKVKFERQSKAKHYPKLPKYRSLPKSMNKPIYNDFIADMRDIEACKKVKYSNYDLGLDKNGKPKVDGYSKASNEEITTDAPAEEVINSEAAAINEVFAPSV